MSGILLPRFAMARRDLDGRRLIGRVSSTTVAAETWVGDRRIGYLIDRSQVVRGRWHAQGDEWVFTSDSADLARFAEHDECELIDSYWGERAELVLTTESSRWSERRWTREDDHDHCAICWANISLVDCVEYWQAPDRALLCARTATRTTYHAEAWISSNLRARPSRRAGR